MLEIIPYSGSPIRQGDVIVFILPGNDRKITHRVVSVDPQGIRTKGDNRLNIDPFVLTTDNIIGTVVSAQRGDRKLRIYGGFRGRLFGSTINTILRFKSMICKLLHTPYQLLSRLGFIRRLLPTNFKMRIIAIKRPSGIEMKLLLGKYIIGRLHPGRDKWWIRRPFRLFVDEKELPKKKHGRALKCPGIAKKGLSRKRPSK